ncbi:MAG TPA: class I SAM-dependent RNA methyltransferase [Terriglobia bacterium]|nr:class I SAM-dependent RNA methyltransferase [Terriglobia bacterium]
MRVTIEKLVYGGAGLARTENGVVFVPRTAPGDVVDVQLVERKSDYAVGRVSALLEPSADRQAPVCPNYDSAGCCHWQHIRYPRQLEIKEAILRETLQRTGRTTWDAPIAIVSGPELHYRLRASFHVQGRKLGFVEERSHKVVPIVECSALSPELNAFIPEGNRILAEPDMEEIREVHVVSGPPVLAAFGRRHVGQGPARIHVKDFEFDLHPEAFFQTNRYLLPQFLDAVLAHAGRAKRVLDLFCGIGFFAIPLARHANEVLGVESSRTAVLQARVNAGLNRVTNAEFFEGDVEDALKNSPDLRPDLVVLNPPRTGAGRDGARLAAGLGAEQLVYVSCNPSTFAREVPVIIGSGYALESLTLVDQFPDTFHIEFVAMFRKS